MTNNRGPLNSSEPTTSTLVGGVYNAVPPAPEDTQVCALQQDSEGNLLVNVIASLPPGTAIIGTVFTLNSGTSNTAAASWTSASSNNSVVTLLNANFDYSTLVVTLNQAPTGTLSAGAATFEVSNDNTNWLPFSGQPLGGGSLVSSYSFVIATYSAFTFDIAGWQYFRVRLSAAIVGTGIVTVGYAAQSSSSNVVHTQSVIDAGRTYLTFVVDNAALVNSEALQTMAINKGGVTSSASSYTVSAGKTLRLQNFSIGLEATNVQSVRGRVLAVPNGNVVVGSPFLTNIVAGNSEVNNTIQHVQGAAISPGSNVTSQSVVLPVAPTLGNAVCVALNMPAAITNLVIKDSNNNLYTVTPNSPSPLRTGVGQVYLAYLLSAPANASPTITATWTTARNPVLYADEFTYGSGTLVFDTDIGAMSSIAGTTINTPTITPSVANELLYACCVTSGTVSAPTAGSTLGVWRGCGGGIVGGETAEYVLSASNPTAVNFTATSSTWSAMAMALRLIDLASGGNALQDFPGGIDLPSGSQIGITQLANGVAGNFFATLIGYEY